MKTKIAWSALALAAEATPLTYQQVTLSQLRTENRTLQAQRTETTRSLPDEAAQARQAADAAELELELQALRAAHANATSAPDPEASDLDPVAAEAEKTLAIAKMNAFKDWGLAMHLYAGDHGDQFPTTLAAAHPFLPERDEPHPLGEDAVEITFQGRFADITDPASTIVAREREPWVSVRGKLCRTYVFVVGPVPSPGGSW